MVGITRFARQYLRVKAARLMEFEGTVFKPGQTKVTYDYSTRKSVTAPTRFVKYTGPMRYWEVPGGAKTVIGEREVSVSQSWVSIPYYAVSPDGGPVLPEMDDVIEITASNAHGDDLMLADKYMRVMSVVLGGGLRSSRKMQVEFINIEEA